MTDFLGKKLPKERNHDLSKIQAAVLACVQPLTSAWQQLLENGLENDQEMRVPAIKVLHLQMDIPVQHTHRPVGGRLAFFVANGEDVSNDPWVLEAVRSYKIDFSQNRDRENHLAKLP